MTEAVATFVVMFLGMGLIVFTAALWLRLWRRCCFKPGLDDLQNYFQREYGEGLNPEQLRREIDRARKEADEALMNTDPRALARIYARLGHYHWMLDENEQAKACFLKAARFGNPFGYLHLAEMEYLADRQEECLKYYRELVCMLPEDRDGFFERVFTLLLERVEKEKPNWDRRKVEEVVRLFYARVNAA